MRDSLSYSLGSDFSIHPFHQKHRNKHGKYSPLEKCSKQQRNKKWIRQQEKSLNGNYNDLYFSQNENARNFENSDELILFILTSTMLPLENRNMLFLQISGHTAESCPMHNDKTKKLFSDFMSKMEPLAKKHGIKIVGSWASMPDHLAATIVDVPTLEAMTQFSMEPAVMEFMSWQTTETKQIMSIEDAMKLLK